MKNALISACAAAKKHDLRRRALFWSFGALVLNGSDSETTTLAKIALAEAFDMGGTSPADTIVRDMIVVCGALRSAYDKVEGGYLSARPELVKNCYVPELCQLKPAGGVAVEVEPRQPFGAIVSDGIAITASGGFIRTCPWCQNLFSPLRSSGQYCCPSCRAAHRNKNVRDAA